MDTGDVDENGEPNTYRLVLSPFVMWNDHAGRPAGTKQIRGDCSHLCWVSLAGQKFMKQHPDAETVCVTCAETTLKRVASMRTVPGAFDEAVANGADAQWLATFMKRRNIERGENL